MRRLYILSYCSAAIALRIFFFCPHTPTTIRSGKGLVVKKEWLVNHPSSFTPREHVRPPDQTFLTFPEWYLVFGPAEQADFFHHDTSTKFPFMAQVRQIWEGYAVIYDRTNDNNLGLQGNGGTSISGITYAPASDLDFNGNSCFGFSGGPIVVDSVVKANGNKSCVTVTNPVDTTVVRTRQYLSQ